MLYFKLYPFTLLRQCSSFTFLFMYSDELLRYYQSSNNLPQSAQTFKTFVTPLLIVDLSPSQSLLLCYSTPLVTLLILDLSQSQSLFLCFAQHLESFCSLYTWLCLNLYRFGLLNTSELICSLLTCLDSLFQHF